MIELIKKALNSVEADNWKILEKEVLSKELFFIRKELDMNRGKKVRKYTVTLYKNFEEEGVKYTGSATFELSPEMTEQELVSRFETGLLAASFVKNPYYPLVEPTDRIQPGLKSDFASKDFMEMMSGFQKAVFKYDNLNLGGVNSAEFFINKSDVRFVNSRGVDVSYKKYNGEIELITDWNENNESVELFQIIGFSDYCPELIEEEAKAQIENSRDRALAAPSKELKNINVILNTEALKEIMGCYVNQTNAQAVYDQYSRAEIGKVFQGETVTGDLLNIRLNPFMANSPKSAPYDNDGFPLSEQLIYKDGVVRKFHGSLQYTSYLGLEPTGTIRNMEVEGGSRTMEELRSEPYFEVVSFSDFLMNPLTGDFGGEIRLGRYFDGEKIVPVTGASISENLFKIHHEIYLSKETTQKENYMGPKILMYPKGHVTGV
ncbi:MAG: modulator protein [Spirochaetales bacterium]|nr:modulator protein [Spirochaetales bacterium]